MCYIRGRFFLWFVYAIRRDSIPSSVSRFGYVHQKNVQSSSAPTTRKGTLSRVLIGDDRNSPRAQRALAGWGRRVLLEFRAYRRSEGSRVKLDASC